MPTQSMGRLWCPFRQIPVYCPEAQRQPRLPRCLTTDFSPIWPSKPLISYLCCAMREKGKVDFFFETETIDYNPRKIRQWIQAVIKQYGQKAGEIKVIFCNDEYLLRLNRQFLNHDHFTDILTFPMEGKHLCGELYISIDRVKENAAMLAEEFDTELLRVIIHGIFHLLGFSDKTKKEKENMRQLEDRALGYYRSNFLKEVHYFDQVYDVVRMIPKGRVSTYGAIADFLALGSARMTGWALNQLKGDVMQVPAHRVVNRNGELTGRLMFGEGGQRMAALLESEGVSIRNNKVVDFEKKFWHPSDWNG